MAEFPQLLVEPGHHECRWFIDGKAYAGALDLNPRRLPSITVFNDGQTNPAKFVANGRYERLVGVLRTNMDVVVRDVHLHPWFIDRAVGQARYAILGLGVDEVPEDKYDGVRLQITALDPLFGETPIGDVEWPSGPSRRGYEQRFAATLSRTRRRWRDRKTGVAITTGYDSSFPVSRHSMSLRMAPMVYADSTDNPLGYLDWIDDWVLPLIGVATFATGTPQKVALLMLTSGGGPGQVRGIVYGAGLDQAPYQAQGIETWEIPDGRPYVTLATLRPNLAVLLRRWQTLEGGDNPFLGVYVYALKNPDLPLRARYLILIQALEALHGFENRRREDEEDRAFMRRGDSLARELLGHGVEPRTVTEIGRLVGKTPRRSLAGRLHGLLRRLPKTVVDDLAEPAMQPLVEELRKRGRTLGAGIHEELAAVRNALSHGERIDDWMLDPWLRPLDIICRATLMRLLRFNEAEIATAFANRTP